jgi:cobaltochelatase CobT
LTAEKVAAFRGQADALACWLRFHDPHIQARYAPAGGSARQLFERLEALRVEALGARRWPGVAANLRAAFAAHCQQLVTERCGQLELADVVPLLLHEQLSGQALPPARFSTSRWRAPLRLTGLVQSIADQARYARESAALIAELGLDTTTSEAHPQQQVILPAAEELPEREATAETVTVTEASGRPWYPDAIDTAGAERYRVFTTEFDEVVGAETLCSGAELVRLRRLLDRELEPLQGLIARLANRLQRHLQAQQKRAWAFDLDEGLLDSRRLPQIIMHPLTPLAFKRERISEFRDTVVALLIDNSRSMRGWPIRAAALSADILARTLERCGVKTEILGFTTRSWKYGPAAERWQAAGCPANPGRLAELRHIVYKAADVPWRRARNHLGLMLRIDALKQNIDGEALAWAHQRLLARPEQRRILVVISDGAPVDELTLALNPPGLLERHLRQVIAWIEQRSAVRLAAIGIGHDVTRYYRRAVMIETAEQFGNALLEQLDSLFVDR